MTHDTAMSEDITYNPLYVLNQQVNYSTQLCYAKPHMHIAVIQTLQQGLKAMKQAVKNTQTNKNAEKVPQVVCN